MTTSIFIGLWILCGIISVIGGFLFDYFVKNRDIILLVGEILPMLLAICFGPLTAILIICLNISEHVEKHRSRIVFEIKRKEK